MQPLRFRLSALVSLVSALLLVVVSASAQDRAKIEIVPNIPHPLPVWSIAFSPDGTHALSGSADNTLKLWDVATGQLLRTFEGHKEYVRSVAFSPDGTRVLSGSNDETLKLWDAATGRLLRTFVGHTNLVLSVAFSPDGTRLLSGSADKELKLWDAATGKPLRTFVGHTGSVNSVAFSPDGTRALSGSEDKTLKLWDAVTGQLLHTFEGNTGEVRSVAFSPEGTRVLSGGGEGGELKLWDAATGQLLRTFEQHRTLRSGRAAITIVASITSVAFSPDGARVLSGGLTLEAWDAASGQLLRTFEGHTRAVYSVAFSPDGTRVLSGSSDNTLKLWDAASRQLLRTFEGHTAAVYSVAFSPDGTRMLSGGGNDLAVNGDKTLKLSDAASGQLLRTFAGHTGVVHSVAVSPDGTRVLSGSWDKTVKLWDAASGQLLRSFEGHTGGVYSVAFAPDGTRVLSGSNDKTLKLWDAASGQLLRTFAGSPVHSVAFSPDGTRVLSGGGEPLKGRGELKLWDVATGQLLRTFDKIFDAATGQVLGTFVGHASLVTSVAFSPDGTRALSGSWDKTVKLWDAASGQLLRTFAGHTEAVEAVAFSPDGTRVLSGSWDKTLKLWDAASGQLLRTFVGHTSWVKSVVFSPDGARALSSGLDGTTRVWNVSTGELLATLFDSANGEWLILTPEGFFAASAKGAELLSVVRDLQLYSIDQFYQALHRPDLVREKLAGDPQGKVREAAAKLDLAKVIAGGSAPLVTIVAPTDGARLSTDKVTLDAAIKDQGGGIGRVEWRVNGTTLGVEERGLARIENLGVTDRSVNVSRTLPIEPGDNVIEMVAYNTQGLIASNPAGIRITRTGILAARPRLFVLAVGINDYWDSRLHLAFAVSDAKSLSEGMRKAGAKLYDQVDVTTVLDAEATAANLDKVFGNLAAKIQPQDVFVFFLAGHGKTLDARYYFLPQDFRYEGEDSLVRRGIGQDHWQEWFSRIPARKSILLFDTCESGSLTGDRITQRGLERVVAVDRMTQAMGRTVLTAATDDAPALEGYRGHGVFTYALLEAMGRADAHADGFIYVTDLASFVDREVPELSYTLFKQRQVPQMKIVGSNFPVVSKTAVLSEAEAAAPSFPTKPTHVVIAPAEVRQSASDGAPVVLQLVPGSQVYLVETTGGFVLVARDGKKLGYVAEKALARMQ